MPKKIVHSNYPWPKEGEPAWKVAVDKLPKPKDLVFRVRTKPVTLKVTEETIGFYKKYAHKYDIPIEQVMGAIIDAYAQQPFSK